MLHCNFNDDCIFARAAHSAKVYRFFIQRGFFTVKIAHKIHNAAVVFVLAALIFVLQPVVGEFERYPFVQVRKLAQAFCNDFGIISIVSKTRLSGKNVTLVPCRRVLPTSASGATGIPECILPSESS